MSLFRETTWMRRRAGFTFVEILAALTFLAILVPSLVGALSLANRASVFAERKNVAVELGENQLNQLVVEKTWSTGSTRGDFGQDRPGFRWELNQNSWVDGEMVELDMDVFFTVQGREHSIRLSTLASPTTTQ